MDASTDDSGSSAGSFFKAPDAFVLIFIISAVVAALTWMVPGGEYERVDADGRQVVVPDSFHSVESRPQGPAAVLMSPLKGFVQAANIIGFVFLIGGAFRIVRETGAVDRGILALARMHGRSAWVRALWIPIFMVIFALGGAIVGMSEEIIPFILIFVPLALTLGYDSITGVAVPYVGAHVGFAAAFLNPFTVGVAQGIADVPLFSGLPYRLFCWLVVTLIAIVYVLWHAERVRKHPERSPTYELDNRLRGKLKELSKPSGDDQEFGKKDRLVLLLTAATLAALAWGVVKKGWYLDEIAALFFLLGIVTGWVARLNGSQIAKGFVEGARELIPTALVIALARGILVLAEDGRIIDPILAALAAPIGTLHPVLSAHAMFVIQTGLNFFVPSGSGQAALTMPIMSPLSDLVGVSRQTAVLAFQLGDGFSNMIIPTSAVLMGVLTIAEIPWTRWARWILPLQVLLFVTGLLLLGGAVMKGW